MPPRHGKIHLRASSVLVREDDVAFEGFLLLPNNARGLVIFGGLCGAERQAHALIVDALVDADLAVLMLPPLRSRHRTGTLGSMAHATRTWLGRQPWASRLLQGLLGCGPMALPALSIAARPECLLRALAIYEGDPNMAEADLEGVRIPTLFAASSEHLLEVELSREMAWSLHGESRAVILDNVVSGPQLVAEWFVDHFKAETDASLGTPEPRDEAGALAEFAPSL